LTANRPGSTRGGPREVLRCAQDDPKKQTGYRRDGSRKSIIVRRAELIGKKREAPEGCPKSHVPDVSPALLAAAARSPQAALSLSLRLV
jgi:hypothetical protein